MTFISLVMSRYTHSYRIHIAVDLMSHGNKALRIRKLLEYKVRIGFLKPEKVFILIVF